VKCQVLLPIYGFSLIHNFRAQKLLSRRSRRRSEQQG